MKKTSYTGQFKPALAIKNKNGVIVATGYKTLLNRKIEFYNFRSKETLTMSKKRFEQNYTVEELV
ncbi:hypothetical protein [Psychrobacter pygoscelis]|uniref:hypothetical protein n=1 Tax=Psychrobacter pygoscelis TaxID=2488563 RepID=UPI00103D5DBE|nr:hypothetical protein [Psychrobacter pygoscelis]